MVNAVNRCSSKLLSVQLTDFLPHVGERLNLRALLHVPVPDDFEMRAISDKAAHVGGMSSSRH